MINLPRKARVPAWLHIDIQTLRSTYIGVLKNICHKFGFLSWICNNKFPLARREFEHALGNLKISLGLRPREIFKFSLGHLQIPSGQREFICKFPPKNRISYTNFGLLRGSFWPFQTQTSRFLNYWNALELFKSWGIIWNLKSLTTRCIFSLKGR